MFSLEEGAELVSLARHAIETLMFNMPLSLEHYKKFIQKHGIYVTLRKDGRIRGQMGTIETRDPLYKAVIKAARDAAFRDKRFSPLTKEELDDVEIEVAIVFNPRLLRVMRAEDYFKHIHPGTDGIAIKGGVYNAVVLPDRTMMYWDAERLLRYLCTSAGLSMDSWKDLSHSIYLFQCQIFAEKNKKVIEII